MPKEKYIGRCPFCNIGEESKRGVLENITGQDLIEYKCGVGKEECIIPRLYTIADMGCHIGQIGDSACRRY